MSWQPIEDLGWVAPDPPIWMVIPLVTEVSWAVPSRVFCAVRFVRPGNGPTVSSCRAPRCAG